MNADWLTSEELDEGPAGPLFTSGSGTISDCDLSSVTVTEVYHSSNDWIEVHNSGNSPCDLGGWHIRDDDTTSGMVVDNWTNITAGGFLLFESAQGDFSFDIGYSDSILVSTRNVSTENATEVTACTAIGM